MSDFNLDDVQEILDEFSTIVFDNDGNDITLDGALNIDELGYEILYLRKRIKELNVGLMEIIRIYNDPDVENPIVKMYDMAQKTVRR